MQGFIAYHEMEILLKVLSHFAPAVGTGMYR